MSKRTSSLIQTSLEQTDKTDTNKVVPIKDTTEIVVLQELLSIHPRLIHPDPTQPRKKARTDEETALLESSIVKTQGNEQAIRIRKHPTIVNEYMIISGEGRWELCFKHNFHVKCELVAYRNISDFETLYSQLTENTARNDLCIYDEAHAIARLAELHQPKPLTQKELSNLLGYNSTKISRLLKIAQAPDQIAKLSQDNVTQNINVLSTLTEIVSLTDAQETNDIVESVLKGKMNEKQLAKKLKALKTPDTDSHAALVESEIHSSDIVTQDELVANNANTSRLENHVEVITEQGVSNEYVEEPNELNLLSAQIFQLETIERYGNEVLLFLKGVNAPIKVEVNVLNELKKIK